MDIYEHAKHIDELYNHQREIARSEGKTFEEYTPRDLVLTAKALLFLQEDWSRQDYNEPYARRQRLLLRNFLKKWEGEAWARN